MVQRTFSVLFNTISGRLLFSSAFISLKLHILAKAIHSGCSVGSREDMPPKRKPPSQRRPPLQEATPNKLNASAAVENLRSAPENHSVGEISRKDCKTHSVHSKDDSTNIKPLRQVHTGRCGKIARLQRDAGVIRKNASRGTRELAEKWPMKVGRKIVDAWRQKLKLYQDFWRPFSDIEITEDGCIQLRQVPYDYWILETKEEKVNLISSFTLGAPSSRAGKDRSVDTKVCPGDTVELKNGALIEIRKIYRHQQGDQVLISGDLFERNSRLMGWLPSIKNEVFWVWTFPKGQDPESAEPFVVGARSSEVLRKWYLHKARPRVSQYKSSSDERSSSQHVQNNITGQGTLICSWKYVRGIGKKIYRTQYNETMYRGGNYDEKLLIPLAATDSFGGSHSPYKRQCHRQGLFSIPGSPRDDSQEQEHISKRENEMTDNYGVPSSKTGDRSQRADNTSSSHTFGDAFAGCGGMSRAAVMVGLEVRWGFDMDPIAIEAYRMNFPNAGARRERADEFVAFGTDVNLQVDILHVSPPCQCFSKANRGNNGNPEQEPNSASLFAIPEIMKNTDPKVVTIEQVPNIMTEFAEYFGAMVQFFTNLGWSIRWKVIKCLDFGVPQTRERLFMIGSR